MRTPRILLTALCFACLLLFSGNVIAQYSLTSDTYNQSFDGLGTATVSNITSGSLTNVSNSLTGWYFYESGGNTSITAGTGTNNIGDTYNFGVTGSVSRTLGGLRSGAVVPYFGFYFTNNSSATITAINITYKGETWRVGANSRQDRLDFQYSIDASALNNGTWVDVNALDYQNSASSIASGSLLQSSTITGTITGISIGVGASLFIRWSDFDATGSDDGMGINDLSFTVTYAGGYSSSTDYFRSQTSGDWSAPASWESSADGSNNWVTATLQPTSAAAGVSIQNGHTITLASNVSANLLRVEAGGILQHNAGIVFSIANSTGVDFDVFGTYLPNGTQPILASGATVQIENGGLVRVDVNTGGEGDDFARNGSVIFKTGAVFQWNAVTAFESSNMTYFTAAGNENERPIFRVTTTPAIGATTTTTFNGKFESNATNFQFFNSGKKIFRDGFGGTGDIVHATDCGTFKITGSDAVIDGSCTITLNNAAQSLALEIADGAYITLSGSAKIAVGSATAPGALLLINGTLKHQSSNSIDLSYGHLSITGVIDTHSTGNFKAASNAASAISNISISGSSGMSAGLLSFGAGQAFVNSFSVNKSGANAYVVMGSDVTMKSLTLINGIVITNDHLFYFLNESGDGSNLSVAPYAANTTTYKNSYVCTCDASGAASPVTDGTKGFRIGNIGTTELMFAVGANLNSPNRMSMKNDGPVDDFTVSVAAGDIGNTPMPVVYRKWYINEANPPVTTTDSSQVSMKLYFTKQDPSLFFNGQDEVETGFDYTDMHLVHKLTGRNFSHNSNYADLQNTHLNAAIGTEIYGKYTKGVSIAEGNRSLGLTKFGDVFGVVNQGTFLLPIRFISFTVQREISAFEFRWSTTDDADVDMYKIEYTEDAIHFYVLATVAGHHGKGINNYSYAQLNDNPGKRYYRVKAINKDGNVYYSKMITISAQVVASFVRVTPNPVEHHHLHIQVKNISPGDCFIKITDITGRVILQTQKSVESSGDLDILLPSSMSKGMYYVVLAGTNMAYHASFLIAS